MKLKLQNKMNFESVNIYTYIPIKRMDFCMSIGIESNVSLITVKQRKLNLHLKRKVNKKVRKEIENHVFAV